MVTTYTVNLTESPVTYTSEGNMDTSVNNGVSLQRTFEMTMVVNDSNGRKIVSRIPDGGTYNDDTTYVPAVVNQPGHPDFQ
jgi:hypothetical protein